jgi:hypothetical protein
MPLPSSFLLLVAQVAPVTDLYRWKNLTRFPPIRTKLFPSHMRNPEWQICDYFDAGETSIPTKGHIANLPTRAQSLHYSIANYLYQKQIRQTVMESRLCQER